MFNLSIHTFWLASGKVNWNQNISLIAKEGYQQRKTDLLQTDISYAY